MRRKLLTAALAALVMPAHLLLALVAPGARLAAPAHVLLRLWEVPPGLIVELLVLIVELVMLMAALAALVVGVLSLPVVAVVMTMGRITAWFRSGHAHGAEE